MRISDTRWIPFILTVAVLVLLNVASSTLFVRADLTRNKAFSLSRASEDAVESLEEPLTIKAFFSKNLPAPYNNTEQVFRDLLEEYSIAGNRFFNYSIISMPSKEELAAGTGLDEEDEARKYRISPVQIQNVEQDEVKLQTVYMGVAFIHGDMIETIPALTSTDNLEYQITGIINRMGNKISALLGMEGTIDVTLYLSANMNELGANMRDLPGQLGEAVNELNQQYYGKLKFDHVDPIATGVDTILETRFRISPLTLSRRTGTEEIREKAYAALVITHGEDQYAQDLVSRGIFGMQISDTENLKRTIEDVAEAVIGVNEEIGFLTGYGIPSLDGQSTSQAPIEPIKPELQNFDRLISSEYSLRTVNLQEEDIPEGLGLLVVAGPIERLSDYDLFRIDQFLMKGGSLALFLDSHSIYLPQSSQFGQNQEPAYIPRNTGLEELLAHYGVTVEQSFVMDEESFRQQQRAQNGGIIETPFYYAPIVSDDRINKNLRFLSNIPEMITLYPAPLSLSDNLRESVDAIEVLSSSKDSWAMSEDINLMYPQLIQPPPDDLQQPYALSYLLEGTFVSYFADKPIPEPEVDESVAAEGGLSTEDVQVSTAVIEEGAGTVFVLGTSAILGNNVLQPEASSGNALFFLNLMDYLTGNEDKAVMRTKGISYVPLGDTTPQLRSFIKTFNIAVLPILAAVAGILVWLGRVSRRKRISFAYNAEASDVE